MNNERTDYLLAYLNELSKLTQDDGYICHKEIRECIGWIREEFERADLTNATANQLIDELAGRTNVWVRSAADSPEPIPEGFTLIVKPVDSV